MTPPSPATKKATMSQKKPATTTITGNTFHGTAQPGLTLHTDIGGAALGDLLASTSPTMSWTIAVLGASMAVLVLARDGALETGTSALLWAGCAALWVAAVWRHHLRPFLDQQAFLRRLHAVEADVIPRTQELLYPWLRSWLQDGRCPVLWKAHTDWRITDEGLEAQTCEVRGFHAALQSRDPQDHPYFPSMAPGVLCSRWLLPTGRWDTQLPHTAPRATWGGAPLLLPWSTMLDQPIAIPPSVIGRTVRVSTPTFAGPRSAHERLPLLALFADCTDTGR